MVEARFTYTATLYIIETWEIKGTRKVLRWVTGLVMPVPLPLVKHRAEGTLGFLGLIGKTIFLVEVLLFAPQTHLPLHAGRAQSKHPQGHQPAGTLEEWLSVSVENIIMLGLKRKARNMHSSRYNMRGLEHSLMILICHWLSAVFLIHPLWVLASLVTYSQRSFHRMMMMYRRDTHFVLFVFQRACSCSFLQKGRRGDEQLVGSWTCS